MDCIFEEKSALRRRIGKLRENLEPDFVVRSGKKAEELAAILIDRYAPRRVGIYRPKGNEFPTQGCMDVLRSSQVQLYLPAVSGDDINFYRYDYEDELVPGVFGISTPPVKSDRLIKPRDLDAIIVPGVAFDYECNRLGWGKGYYDRYLRKIGPETVTVGLAYEFQVLNKIPHSFGDLPVQHIFTERRSTWEERLN